MRGIGDRSREEGADQHQAFQRDVDHPRALGEEPAQSREDQRRRNPQRGCQDLYPEASHLETLRFRRKRSQSPSAETDRITSACRIIDRSRVTFSVSISRSPAPLWSAPKRTAATTIP